MSDQDRSSGSRWIADIRGASLAFLLEVLIVVALVGMAIVFAAIALTVA